MPFGQEHPQIREAAPVRVEERVNPYAHRGRATDATPPSAKIERDAFS
jgi:hypothetical protein